jgi:signal transduction histidine kinase
VHFVDIQLYQVKRIVLFAVFLLSFGLHSNAEKYPLLTKDSLNHSFDITDYKFSGNWLSSLSDSSINDATWPSIHADYGQLTQPDTFKGAAWFRYTFYADSSIVNIPIAFSLKHTGASEIYIDGVLLKKYGTVADSANCRYIDPQNIPFSFCLATTGRHVLSIKYANYLGNQHAQRLGLPNRIFYLTLWNTELAVKSFVEVSEFVYILFISIFSIFIALGLLHLFIFLYNRSIISNLYFSIFSIAFGSLFLNYYILEVSQNVYFQFWSRYVFPFIVLLASLSLWGFIKSLFSPKRNFTFWLILLLAAITIALRLAEIRLYIFLSIVLSLSCLVEILVVIVLAIRRKLRGATTIGIGVLFIAIFILIIFSIAAFSPQGDGFTVQSNSVSGYIFGSIAFLAILSIPFSISIYLAWYFASIHKDLSKQVTEIKLLSEKNLAQEQEKKMILEGQKNQLEEEVKMRTMEVINQKQEIEKQHQQLLIEKNKLEEKSNELTDTLNDLQELQASLIQSEKMASLGMLTAGIAHEIKNPLNFINNFSKLSIPLVHELLEASTDDDKAEAAKDLTGNLEKILQHGIRADSIVKNMLLHGRSGVGEKQLVNINKLSEEFFNLSYHGMRVNVQGFNCTMTKHLQIDLPEVHIVSQDISRVFINLFNNAFYAVFERSQTEKPYTPQVTLATAVQGDKVAIMIGDNGMGISKANQEQIFDPFFTTKPAGQGTGLGLSLSYDIIKAHGGEIRLETTMGEGTTFTILLPV